MSDVFEHPWLSGLFGDEQVAHLWSADTQLNHMLRFEAAWSDAGHLAGLWDEEDGRMAAQAIRNLSITPSELAKGTAKDGVCVPSLVALLKEKTGSEAIHKGATSQDVIDTAMILSVIATLKLIEQRLTDVCNALEMLRSQFGHKPLMGRTRMQAAQMITVDDRLQSWLSPLKSHITRVQSLAPRINLVQIGGAAGDRKALGQSHKQICDAVACALSLEGADKTWHTQRDNIAEFASLLSLITGGLGKIGQDIALMAQQGIDEIVLFGGGGSSAMPHKQNPVLAELLVALASFNATQLSGMHGALVHEQERSGATWTLEWMLLPSMAKATARSLIACKQLITQIHNIGDGARAST